MFSGTHNNENTGFIHPTNLDEFLMQVIIFQFLYFCIVLWSLF